MELYILGINGLERGGTNQVDSLEPGKSGCVHAEINALIRLNSSLHKNCKLYITINPCKCCSRALINTGAIKEVYYLNNYRDISGLKILKKSGIKVFKIKNE